MMTYDETDVAAGAGGPLVDREALLSELVASLHRRIVRHYRMIRVLDAAGRDDWAAGRLAARANEVEDVAMMVLEWMKDPEALEREWQRVRAVSGGGD